MTDKIASAAKLARSHQNSVVTRCRKSRIAALGRNLGLAAVCLLFGLPPQSPLIAQTSSEREIVECYTLQREGKSASAIALLKPLLDSGSLDRALTAKAWDMYGLASKDMGDFTTSRRAFEQSIQTYEGLPGVASDYATALDDFAELYVLTGQLDMAERMMGRALHLYEAVGDHAGVARASDYLAGVFFSQKKVRLGREAVQRAVKESHLTNNLDEDDLATLNSLQGWLANFDGDLQTSESSYRRSLELLRKHHGEEHVSTGWAYVLLGKARAENGDLSASVADMRKGIAILGRTLRHQDPRYLTAEVTYSRVLEAAGERAQAQSLRVDAEEKLKAFLTSQCTDCIVSAKAFR